VERRGYGKAIEDRQREMSRKRRWMSSWRIREIPFTGSTIPLTGSTRKKMRSNSAKDIEVPAMRRRQSDESEAGAYAVDGFEEQRAVKESQSMMRCRVRSGESAAREWQLHFTDVVGGSASGSSPRRL
jgi:hypothetical protein